ncbi:uncharacterized protein LOC100898796 [Galendromus occidentalis]|uniref:Uncharacterized protein LOC100898796 n=1 Tax=Galendromus occidentalis TaxID=34638 RepID=A0AAJ6VZG7_9ACAR|nr:uncharacterized protein LOC100898796 [Galendromus occidentalis]
MGRLYFSFEDVLSPGIFPLGGIRLAYPIGVVRRAGPLHPGQGRTPVSFSASGIWRARKSRYAPIWQFFTRLSPDNAQCNQCAKIVKTPNSGTTGLLFHRKRHLAEELAPPNY